MMHVSKVLSMIDIVSVNVPDKVPNKYIKAFKANANVHSLIFIKVLFTVFYFSI